MTFLARVFLRRFSIPKPCFHSQEIVKSQLKTFLNDGKCLSPMTIKNVQFHTSKVGLNSLPYSGAPIKKRGKKQL